jgi:hypothetical protein
LDILKIRVLLELQCTLDYAGLWRMGRTDNPNFIFYTPTVPLGRQGLRNVLFSHINQFTGRLTMELWFLRRIFEVLYFILY